MDEADRLPGTGTRIDVRELHPGIAAQFATQAFRNGLARIISRDYSQFISKGFEIYLNDVKIKGFSFTVRESEDFRPIHFDYTDDSGVTVELIAGMSGAPPDDLQAVETRAETNYFGWYVLCNDRVVVAADKSDHTVWGDSGFPSWHYQYNGFIGVVSFHAKDPNLLPWRTTKRDVDGSNPAYRRAVDKMKDATRPWIQYTNDRRGDLEEAKRKEAYATTTALFKAQNSPNLVVPRVARSESGVALASIQFRKPVADIDRARKLLGNPSMPNARVGEMAFDYFLKNESDE